MDNRVYDATTRANARSTPLEAPPEEYLLNMALRGRTDPYHWEHAPWHITWDLDAEMDACRETFMVCQVLLRGPVDGRFKSVESDALQKLPGLRDTRSREKLFQHVVAWLR